MGEKEANSQNGICPLQVTFSQLTASSSELVPFGAAVLPNVPHCQCSLISLCILEALREVQEENSYENTKIATSMGIGSFCAAGGLNHESMNCVNRSDHQAPRTTSSFPKYN